MIARDLGDAPSLDDAIAWLLGPGHRDLIDEDARPLGERASPRYGRCPVEERRRAFGDRRDASGLPINHAALRQLKDTWPRLLAALSSFEPDRPPDVYRAWRRAQAATRLAPLRALRDGAPPSRFAAALHKVTLGFSDLLAALLLDGRLRAHDPLPTDNALLEVLDAEGWLVGDVQVCAGTRSQIAAVWRALGAEADDVAGVWADLAPALDATEELSALAAVAAGAARAHLLHGAAPVTAACVALYQGRDPPRVVRALRGVPEGGPLHPLRLFPPEAPPASVIGLIDALPPLDGGAAGPLLGVDAGLVAASQDPALRLARWLGRPPVLSVDAFAEACAG